MKKESALVPKSEGTQRCAKPSIRLCRKGVGQKFAWQTFLLEFNLEHGEKYHCKDLFFLTGSFQTSLKMVHLHFFSSRKALLNKVLLLSTLLGTLQGYMGTLYVQDTMMDTWHSVKQELRQCVLSQFSKDSRG